MIPSQIIGVFRAARVVLHLACGLMIASVFNWLSQSVRRRILRRWSAQLLNILNVSITAEKSMHALRSGIIVTNHISWLDVFVLNAVIPMRFVAKSEVRQWPLIGWLCARAQTLFIERGRARDAARINIQIVQLLQNGECLAVFPEGTTTDGTQVGSFHASLLQPAVDAGAEVHPVAIRYQDAQGAHCTAAAYIDDLSFAASLWNILNCRSLHVRLLATPSLDAAGSDRRTLTRTAWQQISNVHNSAATTGTFDERYEILIPPLLKQQPVTDCAV
jgi:1-acyl-sn-glycerol-3-phosphate acyltransferase